MQTTHMTRPKAISLFSGAGGMDIGFRNAGFDIRACVELDPSCCETLRANIFDSAILEKDVRNVSGDELLEVSNLRVGELDLLFGGPPCQSFSLAGNRDGLNDDRGQLIFEFVRLVMELEPKVFVMENVAGMASWSKGKALDDLKLLFESENPKYSVHHSILNAKDFGAPQERKRVILVGRLDKGKFHFPVASHGLMSSFVSVGEALATLPEADSPSDTARRVAETIKERRKLHGY